MRLPVFDRPCSATELCEPCMQAGLKRAEEAAAAAADRVTAHALSTAREWLAGVEDRRYACREQEARRTPSHCIRYAGALSLRS